MGFYVSGVDAPKNCRECGRDLATIANCVYTKRLVFPEEHDMSSGRHPLCPIFPVETPHGRLVDTRGMFLPFVVEGQRSKRYHLGEKWELNGAEIREVIDSLPTIIPAEPSEEQREYESDVEYAQYCEIYEPSYDPETGAL